MGFAEKVEKAIPSEVCMISLSPNDQASLDVFQVGDLALPKASGRTNGMCTLALLQILNRNHKVTSESLSWDDVLRRMRQVLENQGNTQMPQLTSSRVIDVQKKPVQFVPSKCTGTKRALLIGINYTGEEGGELRGCHKDVENSKDFLMNVHGFKKDDITILIDKQGHPFHPTRRNIITSFRRLVATSHAGDVVVVH